VPLLDFTAIYKAVSGYPPNVQTFNAAQGSAWVFPYFPGNVNAHSVGSAAGALTNGENDLQLSSTTDGTYTWDAELQLSSPAATNPIQTPGDRNIFTYLGGFVSDDTSKSVVNRAPNKVLQIGWTPEDIDGTKINNSMLSIPNPNCVDVMGLSHLQVHNGTDPDKGLNAYDPSIPFSGPDGICDLQEAAGLPSGLNPDNGPSPANITAFMNDFGQTQQILQKVRGYCYANSSRTDGDPLATPVLTPSATTNPSQCNDPNADNKAHLGGFVYSAPAIIPYSANIKDVGTNGATQHRPTIAVAAAYDGMVHAFYVAGGAGYQGVQGAGTTVHFRHQSPANNGSSLPGSDGVAPAVPVKFNHPWLDPSNEPSTTAFVPPPPMTELWAFMPASQLANIRLNNTKVDSSVVVQDVFGDFGFTGTSEWHTVISGSAGSAVNGTYSEVYALDVTNPLKPVLLWDLVGAWDRGGAEPNNTFPGFQLANDNRGPGQAPGYTNTYGVGSVFQWDGKNAEYEDNPALSDPGRQLWALYDYHQMGGAQGLAMLQFTPNQAVPPRAQGSQVAEIFVSTNAGKNDSNNDGANVFAIEAVTGQQVWNWKIQLHQGDDDGNHHHGNTANAVPPAASLFYDDVGANYSLLFGDQLGRVWSLDPGTGESNYVMSSNIDKHGHHHGCGSHSGGHGCGCPAVVANSYDNDPTPISTLVSVARIPQSAGSPFNGHGGEEVIIFGTGAEPWAYSSVGGGNHVRGQLHLGYLRGARVCDDNARDNTGVLYEPTGFPYQFPNDISVNGDISVSGELAWFGTTTGALNDLFAPVANITGGFYALDLGGGCDNTILTCNVPGMPIGQWGVFNRGTYGGGPTVLHDTVSNNDYVVGTQTTRVDALTINNGGSLPGKATAQTSLSVGGTGTGKNGAKGVTEWVKRRLR
jgi:type IV pilus assembly protein PilY1